TVGVGDVKNRLALRSALHTLEDGGKESAAPEALSAGGISAARDQDDKARQVLVFAAQAIGDPRTHRSVARPLIAGEEKHFCGSVIELIRPQRLHQRDVINDRGEVREQFADPRAALSMLGKPIRASQKLGRSFDEREALAL